jgi:hypothetical protein
MTGFLADLGLDTIEDDPNALPDSKHAGYVFDAKVVSYKDTAKGKALVLTYKVSEGTHKGKTCDEFKSCNAFDDASKKGWLKQRVKSLGVPEEKLATLDPKDLIGIPVWFTTKKNGDYTNVRFVEVRDENATVVDDTVPEQAVTSAAGIEDLL